MPGWCSLSVPFVAAEIVLSVLRRRLQKALQLPTLEPEPNDLTRLVDCVYSRERNEEAVAEEARPNRKRIRFARRGSVQRTFGMSYGMTTRISDQEAVCVSD